MLPTSLLGRLPIRSATQVPVSCRLGVVSSSASARLSTFDRKQRSKSKTEVLGVQNFVLKPFKSFSRGFSSHQNPGSGGSKWLLAFGATFIGIGGATLAYLYTDEGKKYGDDAFIVSCAGKEGKSGEADCVERKCGDSDCLRKLDCEEELIIKANSDLEKALKDVKTKAVEYTEAALKAYCEATDLMRSFMDKVYCAIEEDNLESPRFQEVWCDIYENAQKKCEKVKEAMSKGQCAWEMLCRLREVVESGKACKYASCNPLLITAEESLMCGERELLNAKSKMECLQSESHLIEQYRKAVEDFRRELKTQVDSMIPSEECKGSMTGNECTMVITHAYKKVVQVQKELAQVQFMATASLESDKSVSANYQRIQQEKMATDLRQQFERDIIEALKRQASAYQENFDNQINTLKMEYERRLKQQDKITEAERVVALQAKYNQASAALAAIESGIEARQGMNSKAQKLRKLWSTCNALFSRVNYSQYYNESSSDNYATINKGEISEEFKEDLFVSSLIDSLPEKVTSFEGLKQRFFAKLDPAARKTMMFKDGEKLSLWKYALGSLEASLIARCDGERENPKTTYEILDRAGFHLKRGNLLDATIILNTLTGLSRQVAMDWLKDARIVLETNQTLFSLMTYAASNNVY